ncbi:siderophore-interacting protein [Microbacterium sp. NPDC055683]
MTVLPQSEVATAEVVRVMRLSPTFVRITFGGDGLDRIGTPGHVFDARIRLIFPAPFGRLLRLSGAGWMSDYRALPDDERGPMRTYSIRELRAGSAGTEVDIDFVLHLEPGSTGPATTWASAAQPGERILLAGPSGCDRRAGVEFDLGALDVVDIAGDETAWETRIYSRTGQDLDDGGEPVGGRYIWIAGESAIVTTLRRHLVDRHAVRRSQVAFMGYWKASRPAG